MLGVFAAEMAMGINPQTANEVLSYIFPVPPLDAYPSQLI